MRPGRQEKPVDRARPDWIETRLGATSRTRLAKPVDKASKAEEADWSDMGKLLCRLRCASLRPPPTSPDGQDRLRRSRRQRFAARRIGAISAGSGQSEVRFDSAGARFRPLAHMGSRVRRDSAQSHAAKSQPGAPLLRARGEEGHTCGRQRLCLAGRDSGAQSAVRRSDLPPFFRRRRTISECRKRLDRE